MERKWWTLVAVCVATFMLLLDITIVNVALPDIQKETGASFDELQWVVDAYSLALAGLLLAAGSLADRLGRRRAFVAGVGIFTIASFLCGVSGDATVLDFARGLQGIGGAAMFATSLALLAQEFHGRERGTAFGVWGATIGGAVAIGPLVGGALTQGLGWEWIFFVNVPIGIATIALAQMRVHETKDPTASGVDWLGTATFSGALIALVFALIRGNAEGWGSALIIALLAAAVVLLVVFVLVELRQETPMLDLALFRKPTFTGASIVAFALSASMFAMFLYITLYLQNILGFSPLDAGLRFLPLSLISFFVAAAAGPLSERFPKRIFFVLGLVLVGFALLWMGQAFRGGLTVDDGWTAMLGGFIVAGIGIGMINPPLAATAVGVVPPQRAGMGSGINTTFRQVGIATGIAGLGAIFQHQVSTKATELLAASPLGSGQSGRLVTAIQSGRIGEVIAAAPPQARGVIGRVAKESFISGLNELFVIAGIVAFVGAASALVLVRSRDYVMSGAQAEPEGAPAG
jgi:EmrB/QacA subfamily drug resistance transporter